MYVIVYYKIVDMICANFWHHSGDFKVGMWWQFSRKIGQQIQNYLNTSWFNAYMSLGGCSDDDKPDESSTCSHGPIGHTVMTWSCA